MPKGPHCLLPNPHGSNLADTRPNDIPFVLLLTQLEILPQEGSSTRQIPPPCRKPVVPLVERSVGILQWVVAGEF